ncbi:unnamed protein product [Brassicogethes aeneus]|uniref:ascorbate ferrireductase (transmembrane) n=1 Tax=Brassicogethes aeneus TaxID=1431903 RepID=A0A9P0BBN8_BRAAE|nr:unnamed protein product [Brassicogethes aeneus]
MQTIHYHSININKIWGITKIQQFLKHFKARDCLPDNIDNCLNNESIADVEMGPKLRAKEPPNKVNATLTNVAHFCTCVYTLLVIYLALTDTFVFFTWHPILMSIGWTLLMTEGVLALEKDNSLTKSLKTLIRWRTHWIALTIAITCILTAFFIVFLNKDYSNKPHFKTWHGLFGLIGTIAAVPTCINGIPLLWKMSLTHIVSPKIVKFVHVSSSIVALIFGGISLSLSVYTNWFTKHTKGSYVCFIYGVICVGFLTTWVLVKPFKYCFRFIKNFCVDSWNNK